MSDLPPIPPTLKTIQHYLKTAQEHEIRDPVVTYWCRVYALQQGLKLDRKSPEAKAVLAAVMDRLEEQKKEMSDNEAITNDLAAQAHLENYALKLFLYADTYDRAANFGKNVVKAFYTAGILFDVLTVFGDLSEELSKNRKYAKWKAAYIHNCLKRGETPVPGPMRSGDDDDEEEGDFEAGETSGATGGASTSATGGAGAIGFVKPEDPPNSFDSAIPPARNPYVPPTTPSLSPNSQQNYTGGFVPYQPTHQPTTPVEEPNSLPGYTNYNPAGNGGNESDVSLTPEQVTKAQKYCKWAGSALNYDDVSTAITNLQRALKLLQTGRDD